ncbi:hypothetical protein VTL71DRAFT_11991 [Oculimacula yallundae]|uniref:Uncharacterized protein n=1 Tax=Oculimacula yallundae TaxID=86028 RepID=A0ABR4CRL6_9HELO
MKLRFARFGLSDVGQVEGFPRSFLYFTFVIQLLRLALLFFKYEAFIMHALMQYPLWKKRYIVTIWSVQIPLLAISIIVLGILIGIELNAPEDSFGNSQSTAQIWTIVNLALAAITFLIDCLELSIYIHNDLFPKLYLVSNIFKFLVWIVPFVWNIYMTTSSWQGRGWNDIYLWVAISFSSLVFVTFAVSLIYASLVYQKYRRRAMALYETYSASK